MRDNASRMELPTAFLSLSHLDFTFIWSCSGTVRHPHHNPIIKYGHTNH